MASSSSSRLVSTSFSRLGRSSALCRFGQEGSSAMSIKPANLDRYSIVQTFFRKQASKRLSPSTTTTTQSIRFFSSSPSHHVSPKPPSSVDNTSARPPSSSILPIIPKPSLDPKEALDKSSSPSLPPDPRDPSSDSPLLTAPSDQDPPAPPTDPLTPHPSRLALIKTYPSSLRRLAALLPASHLADPHNRPTKADLLKLTDSWLQRLRIRWKWFTIRGFRKFGPDEWSAVASWVLIGNLGWLVLGTTTFMGMVLLTANSLSLQGHIAKMLSDYFTSGSGITVIFESALVPNLLQSTISLRNVFISRRPSGHSYNSTSSFDAVHQLVDENGEAILPAPESSSAEGEEEEDTNYSMFDLNVDSIDVTLNFMSWLNGDGLVKKAVVRGVRGVVDRRSVAWDPDAPWIPSEWRHPVQPGDGSFNLDSLQVEDLLCTVYQPGGFRPYNVSIFKADLGKFRKKWLFLDVLSAESITGQYDNCLFSLHKPQRIGKTMGEDEKDGKWTKMARMRIDGLPIDHCQGSSTTGPLAWITAGKLDGVIDIKFPRHPDDDVDFTSVLSEIIDNVQEIATSSSSNPTPTLSAPSPSPGGNVSSSSTKSAGREVINPGQRPLGKPALVAPEVSNWREMMLGKKSEQEMAREVVMDIDLRFRDLKAAVPYRAAELSYVNSALIRPIVAFINANRTLLPIQCRVVQDLSEFDGSWTPFETGLLDATSNQVYSALAHHVTSQTANTQRMKAVGVWSLQMTAEMVVSAVRTAVLQGRDFGLTPPQGPEMMMTL